MKASIAYYPYNYGREYSWHIVTETRGEEYGHSKTWEEASREIVWRAQAATLGIPVVMDYDESRWEFADE